MANRVVLYGIGMGKFLMRFMQDSIDIWFRLILEIDSGSSGVWSKHLFY